MNTKEWRRAGWATLFFRVPLIILVNRETLETWARPIDRGRWMEYDHLSPEAGWTRPPLEEKELDKVKIILAACYCDRAVRTCDFCANVRLPD